VGGIGGRGREYIGGRGRGGSQWEPITRIADLDRRMRSIVRRMRGAETRGFGSGSGARGPWAGEERFSSRTFRGRLRETEDRSRAYYIFSGPPVGVVSSPLSKLQTCYIQQ
jgi:hypothetical protein